MFRKLSLVLVFVLGAVSVGVSALGLGEIKLESGLNQPLKAEIELFSPEGMSEFEVAATLASRAEFEKAGIDYLGFLRELRFKTVKRGPERLVVEITTRQPIKEPFLNFLVELNWPKGRMLREYTLLLDPPVFSESRSSTVNQASSLAQQTTQTYTPPARQTTRSISSGTSTPPSQQPVFSGTSYGPVGNAETLWRISTKVRPTNATIHQTLVALFRANPDAFLNGDINLLKEGAVLDIPSASEIASTPHRAALQDMVARLRGGSRDTVLDTSGRSSSNQRATRGGDRLRLSSPGSSSGDSSGASVNGQQVNRLKSELASTKEAAATLEAENEELRRKLQDALGKLEDQQSSAVDVDSTAGAALANQDDVFASEETTDESLTDTMDSSIDDSMMEDDASTSDSTVEDSVTESSMDDMTSSDSMTDDAVESTSSQSEVDDTVADTKADTSPSQPKSSLSQPPQASEAWYENIYILAGAGGLVILLIVLAVFWKMRQRMSDEDFQDDLVGTTKSSGFDTEESIDMPDVGDDLLGDLDSDDVFDDDSSTDADPLGEADIYIAYGKYDQAEKLLKEAIEQHPERSDLKVKLLECFAETKDQSAFEEFENLHSDVWASDSDAARQVSELKAQAWPGESSVEDEFELPSTEEIFGEEEPDLTSDDDFSLDDLDTESDISLDDMDEPDIGGEDESFDTDDMDFNIDDDSSSDAAASLDDDDFSLDDDTSDLGGDDDISLDLDDDDVSLDSESLDDAIDLDAGADDDLASMDLDADVDLGDTDLGGSDLGGADLGSSDDDLGGDLDLDGDMDLDGDFDLDDDDGLDDDLMDGTDEASTKLDLARAYIDMGDTDGAKEILNEVVEEGNEAHKNEAMSLLQKI
ncbi:FimV/HubP family polar landmark protein [Pleionea sediminis]|uniref:FimV/HubP family polar landmark protein n=1 Tax=Pleionea sediminis TaxID=2569479 RepID=UPI00118677E3|nr:FimV/HubP family polar landmark protein [Pleionea sediminis]